MAILNIVKKGDGILKKKCREVTDFNKRLHILLDDMFETLTEAQGAGLAAPQVGVLKRVCIVQTTEDDLIELINPEIIEKEGEQIGAEGCLSIPGYAGTVTRPMKVKVRAQDRRGNFFEAEAEDFRARAFCHEIDHLNGILYTDLTDDVFELSAVEDEEEEE